MPDLVIKPENTSGNKLILQDQAGGAVLTTADSGATVANATLTTPTIASMANCTFPAGHIIKSDLLYSFVDRASGLALTGSTSFQDTGVAGSITTLKSSSDSRLVFSMVRSMMHCPASHSAETTLTLRSSSSTTYASGDDIIPASQSYRNYFYGGLHKPRYDEWHYKVGNTTPANLGSYSAGDTIYWRIFGKIGDAGQNYTVFHSDSNAWVTYAEIAI